ncbi:small multidrug efflux protein [Herbiconiux sp. VKM Ac-1786]|uniref:small multidrug efflux protein n=1 Tax=Herbiconiux sp. VKM Ac-1786 TaxID=2783824 RepID=UPI00188BEE4A|nr:small multidrug efflux protein [Herbiconiux sp. VKM Ac-1786]MBF4571181.1 small multidrug efflux protein [Herbiconiux sp. VKM Ac-1786]
MDVIAFFQQAMSHVPVIVQPLLVALAGVIPFVEGELAAVLGVWAGLNPVVAALAAAAGNFASVFVVVFFGARIRAAVVTRRARKAAAARAAAPVPVGGRPGETAETEPETTPKPKPESKGVQRFKRFLVRFGVPGASILGPLALPTQFTSAVLVSTGVAKGWVLLWQAVAIVLWTTVTTLGAVGVLALLEG